MQAENGLSPRGFITAGMQGVLHTKTSSPDMINQTTSVRHSTTLQGVPNGTFAGTFISNYPTASKPPKQCETNNSNKTPSQFDKFQLNTSPSVHALNRFSTNSYKPVASNYQSLEQCQAKGLLSAKNVAGTGKMRMSERQSEWYLTDKRLIFSCNNAADFKTWVAKIEELISHNTHPSAAPFSIGAFVNPPNPVYDNPTSGGSRLQTAESPRKFSTRSQQPSIPLMF